MAYTSLLHSGEFVDYDGNIITIEFFKRTDINASPASLSYSDAGGFRTLTIWSRDGDAYIADPQVDWWNYQQTKAEPLPGSDYYKYTYRISCNSNSSGEDRETVIHVHLEGVGGVHIDVPIYQAGD